MTKRNAVRYICEDNGIELCDVQWHQWVNGNYVITTTTSTDIPKELISVTAYIDSEAIWNGLLLKIAKYAGVTVYDPPEHIQVPDAILTNVRQSPF